MQLTSKSRPNYSQFRKSFLERAQIKNLKLRQLEQGAGLFTDYAYWDNNSPRTLVQLSGTHGIEGYFGSLLQQEVLQRFDPSQFNCNVVFVHAVNPFGMNHYRRTNRANVDLNRNAIDHTQNPAPNHDYEMLRPIMEPQSLIDFWSKVPMGLWRALRMLKKPQGLQAASGQFNYPQGLFFGGHELQPEAVSLGQTFRALLPQTQTWFFIDVHTGLGPFAKESLILDGDQNELDASRLKNAFQAKLVEPGKTRGFYRVDGMLAHHLRHQCGDILHITQEFGTRNFLSVLSALALENMHFHRDLHSEKMADAMLEVFFPSSPLWRKTCLELGILRFQQAIEFLKE